MADMNIRTVIGVLPHHRPEDRPIITRGATADLRLNLFTKVYTIYDIDQLTVVLEQKKLKKWFKMIDYFILTTDTVAKKDKSYYNRIALNISGAQKYKFVKFPRAEGEDVVGLFEEHEIKDGEVTENWQYDEHFFYEDDLDEFNYISFRLSSEETKEFLATEDYDDRYVKWEVAVKLNTDYIRGMHNKDSIIIERQPNILVMDSLFGNMED